MDCHDRNGPRRRTTRTPTALFPIPALYLLPLPVLRDGLGRPRSCPPSAPGRIRHFRDSQGDSLAV